MDPFEKLNTSTDSTVSIVKEAKKNIKFGLVHPNRYFKKVVITKGYEV